MLQFAQYVRKSDDDTSVTEKSIGEQLEQTDRLVAAAGLLVVKQWRESQSAKLPNRRPGYSEMIRLVEQGKINAIVCWHINRLVRNMEEGGKLVQLFIEGKIKEIRTPSALYRTGDNILPLVIEAASATQFSLDHTRNVNRGMVGKFTHGGCNYRVPQGYYNARDPLNLKKGVVKTDLIRYRLMRKAWELLLTGAYSPAQVIRTLDEEWGYRTRKTKKGGGSRLSRSSAYQLFTNPFYAGFVRQKGELIKGNHEPMVTVEEFNRAQELLSKHKSFARKHHAHAYTGLMRCVYCGQQVTAEIKTLRNGTRWESYRCSDSRGRCTKQGLSAAQVERAILRELNAVMLDPSLVRIALENIERWLDRQDGAVESLYAQQERTLQSLDEKLEKLSDMWLEGILTDAGVYQRKEAKLKEEKAKLVLDVAASKHQVETMRRNARAAANYMLKARDAFQVSPLEQKREIAQALAVRYDFDGRKKQLRLVMHPLLAELNLYARRFSGPFEPPGSGSDKTKRTSSDEKVFSGGPANAVIEPGEALQELLAEGSFRELFPVPVDGTGA